MDDQMFRASRREVIRLAAAGLVSAGLPLGRASRLFADPLPVTDFYPLAQVTGTFDSSDFNGDDVRRPHDLLWNIENYVRAKGGRPSTTEAADVVVVGGGIAGLLAAHRLRGFKPLILEQAERFGGNAKGEIRDGTAYSIGAAYLGVPDSGDEMDSLLNELGLHQAARVEEADDLVVNRSGRGLSHLWNGEAEPGERAAIAEVGTLLANILESGYPDIPWKTGDPLSRSEMAALDSQTAAQWLSRRVKHLPDSLHEYFQLYCWSSFGGSLDELSAAHFLNFMAAEQGGVMALPGGNATIADAVARRLVKAGCSLNANSMVLEVLERGNGVEVLYEDASGRLRRVTAGAVIVAAPKYVARYLVKGLERDRDEFWKQLPYRAYVVANVLLEGRVPSPAFDIYCLRGQVPETPTFGRRMDREWTDVVCGGWAARDAGAVSVLTFYRPIPFDGARSLISSKMAHDRFRAEITGTVDQALRDMGWRTRVASVRLTRWGHAIPLARPGFLFDERLSAGVGSGRIQFAGQDEHMNPSFESGFASARRAAGAVENLLVSEKRNSAGV